METVVLVTPVAGVILVNVTSDDELFTSNPFERIAYPPSALVTMTSQVPAGLFLISNEQVMLVVDMDPMVAEMFVEPLLRRITDWGDVEKEDPVTIILLAMLVLYPLDGLMDEMDGVEVEVVPVAVNVTDPTPLTDVVRVFAPAVEPSVQVPEVAIPLVSVNFEE